MTENPFEDFDLDVKDADLSTVSRLGEQLIALEAECNQLEEMLNAKKKQLWVLRTEKLPQSMIEVGLQDFTLTSGQKIEVKEKFQCTLPKELHLRDQAFEWLRTHNAGELIRRKIELTFGKGQDELAERVKQLLSAQGVEPFSDSEDVHWRTLTSWAKERHEAGDALPRDILGLYIGHEAKVKK